MTTVINTGWFCLTACGKYCKAINGVLQLTSVYCKAEEIVSSFTNCSVSKADGDVKHAHAKLIL